jgi:hypothetical protein
MLDSTARSAEADGSTTKCRTKTKAMSSFRRYSFGVGRGLEDRHLRRDATEGKRETKVRGRSGDGSRRKLRDGGNGERFDSKREERLETSIVMDIPFEFVGKVASASAVPEAGHVESGSSTRHDELNREVELSGRRRRRK